ncbi:MAG: DUF4836 family protein [Microscillaceae bacterium]|jgi:hypothetical protein|nr:DUF4836 family protein [Microscillaceae bacterium]
MKKHPIFGLAYIFLFGLIIGLNACNSKVVAPTHIPADATTVVGFNFKAMTAKAMQWQDMLNPELLRNFYLGEEADITAQILNSGIDYQADGYIFAKVNAQETDRYVAGVFQLNSESRFEKALKASYPKREVKSAGKLKFMNIDNLAMVGWQDKKVWVVSLGEKTTEPNLKNRFDKIRNTQSTESLEAKNAQFKELLQGEYDCAFWADYQKSSPDLESYLSLLPESMQNIKDLLQITQFFSGTLRFENGQIAMKGISVLNPKIQEKYQDLFKSRMDAALIKAIPIKDPIMATGGGAGMKGVQKLLTESGILETKDVKFALGLMEVMEMSQAELFDTFNGDVVLAVRDVNTSFFSAEAVEYAIGIGINNRKNLDKLLENVSNLPISPIKKKENYYFYKSDDLGKFYLVERDNMIFITGTTEIKDNFVNAKEKLNAEWADYGNGAIGFWQADVVQLTKLLPESTMSDADSKNLKEIFLPNFKSIIAKSSAPSGNTLASEMIVKMTDPKRNALTVIVEAMRKMEKKKPKVNM